ncbi:MAG: beta-propeller domain-containing protein [Candidatus Woesearchaeota archaeon]
MKKIIISILIVFAALLVVYQLNNVFSEDQPDFSDVQLKQLSSVDELNQIFSGATYRYGGGNMRADVLLDSAVAMPSSESASRDFSKTNIQVQGIDEADLLKTDGQYVYTISANNLFIINAYPAKDAKVLAIISFDKTPNNLFLYEDKLVVFGHIPRSDVFLSRGNSQSSFIKVYDISNKEEPVLTDQFEIEGNYFEARLKDDHAYIFTNTFSYFGMPMPLIVENGVQREVPITSIYRYDRRYNNPSMLSVFSLDLNNNELDSNSFVVEFNVNLYVSHKNIFLTHTHYVNEHQITMDVAKKILEPKLSREQRDLILEIQSVSSAILSDNEKEQRILDIYEQVVSRMSREDQLAFEAELERLVQEEMDKIEHFETTRITKISYDNGFLRPIATGEVPGRVLNKFSMDEDANNDVFRIATTISARWHFDADKRTLSSNNVYTLNNNLNIMSRLEGLAEDERIYSARFMDERLYMVTFREVDPFFVIDLSDPYNIQNLGELKIPGFSTYLHPYDETTIIGIGQEASERGEILGLKISLFDVSNPSDPIEISKYVGEDRFARSTALFEHKAFLFNKQRDLLVIPVFNYDFRDTSNNYNGALVFNVTKQNVELRGLIDHSSASTDGWRYSPSVERSFYIEDVLYTKSSNLLRMNDVSTLQSINNLSLVGPSKIPIY